MGNGVPLYNRYSSLENEDHYVQQPYNTPFLGQRGRGGRRGTPRGNPRTVCEKGGGRNVPPYIQNKDTMPPSREEGDVGQENPNNPKKMNEKCINTGIYNLSGVELDHKELNILNLGLKCAPKKMMNKFEVYIDTHKFIRSMNIKKYFLSHPVDSASKATIPSG